MEHQTISSMGFYNIPVIAHELAHQWWGNMVTTRNWHHIWLNEGFASYSEALLVENWYGVEEYHRYMDGFAYHGPGTIYVQDTTNVARIFSANLSYAKGAYVLHMLRHVLGDEDFFRTLLEYRDQYYMDTAVTEDFQKVAEQVSGKDLAAFFRQWIYGEGEPQYLYSYDSAEIGDHYRVNVRIEQIQDSDPFIMPVDLYFQAADGRDSVIVVQNFHRDQLYTFQIPWQPVSVELDPEDWILKQANLIPAAAHKYGDDLFSEFQIFPNYPNPFQFYTNIYFTIPENSLVTIRIFDLHGKIVRVIARKELEQGPHWFEWDGMDETGKSVSSGIYFLQVHANGWSRSQKLTKLK